MTEHVTEHVAKHVTEHVAEHVAAAAGAGAELVALPELVSVLGRRADLVAAALVV